jgi:uncharacterized protein (TIGR03437 family)
MARPGNTDTLYKSNADVAIYFGGKSGTVLFNGLTPGFPGLYQINVTLQTVLPGTGRLPLAIGTNSAYHDQVDTSVR